MFFMDNAGIHHSYLIHHILKNFDASTVFNTIKSPFYNPAELTVSFVKQQTIIQYYVEEYDLI